MPGRLRRITVYETSTHFYLVGSDLSGTRFNVLKIDRLNSKVLLTGDPEHDYTKADIMELLATISEGNSIVQRGSNGKRMQVPGGLIERVSNAYGILGVVRFVEGFYLILITKATVVASLGYHSIYKVAEVAMISIGIDGLLPNSSEEQRYLRIFQSVDLTTDFYFSYTYDLSRSLQENCISADWENNGLRTNKGDSRFIWNEFLLEPLRKNLVSERWMLEVIHGFVGQQIVELPTATLSLILIGRRSACYAGTRFLKRGANLKGDVANDVETEQVVWDRGSPPHFAHGRFSSFVQRRGSVPLRWSQDPATRGVVGKPLILIDVHEPHAQTAGAHFRDLRNKYGHPIVVYNLVKRREKRRHEALLHDQFLKAIDYLNQFVPNREHIAYVAFDVARCNKNKEMNVLSMLDETAMRAVVAHGWFQTFPLPNRQEMCPREVFENFRPKMCASGRFQIQQGVSRTNCVDCLDRTNVAQFAIGKAALACQLFAMGLLEDAYIDISSELCRVYEELFDTHGDTMAWQYAGSSLVHSIKTYKKTAALQERSRDVIQTLSRYYSNTFADYDKQNAINLFLGMYRPQITSRTPLWDLPNDYYLHFPPGRRVKMEYCAWMYDDDELSEIIKEFDVVELAEIAEEDDQVRSKHKSDSTEYVSNQGRENYAVVSINSDDDFREYYRSFEMTTLENKIKQQAYFDLKKISVGGVNDAASMNSGFGLWKKNEPQPPAKKVKAKNKDKTPDTDDEDEEIDDEVQKDAVEDTVVMEPAFERQCPPLNNYAEHVHGKDPKTGDSRSVLFSGLRSCRRAYGVDKLGPGKHDLELYERYVAAGGLHMDADVWETHKPTRLSELPNPREAHPARRLTTIFTTDSTMQTEVPEVSSSSLLFYMRSADPQQWKLSTKDQAAFATYAHCIH